MNSRRGLEARGQVHPLLCMPAGVNASAGLAFADFGVPLCRELAALFKGPEEAAAAERTAAGAKGSPQQPGSPEVNNSTGEDGMEDSTVITCCDIVFCSP